jgi:hypothetical protein
MSEKRSIFVAIPCLDGRINTALSGFLRVLDSLSLQLDYPFTFLHGTMPGCSPVEYARNCLVRRFLEMTTADYLWFIDNDAIPSPSSLRIFEADADMVTGRCFIWRHDDEGRPQLFINSFVMDRRPDGNMNLQPVKPRDAYDVIKDVDAAGAACLLIKRRVFEDPRMRLDARWTDIYGNSHDLDDERGRADYAPPFFRSLHKPNGHVYLGEDIDFTRRARNLGYTLKVHLGASFGHHKAIDLDAVATLYTQWLDASRNDGTIEATHVDADLRLTRQNGDPPACRECDILIVIPTWDPLAAFQRWRPAIEGSSARVGYIVVVSGAGDVTTEALVGDVTRSVGLDSSIFQSGRVQVIIASKHLLPIEAMQLGAEAISDQGITTSIVGFLHDDAVILDPAPSWEKSLLDFFSSRPRAGLVGFGGRRGIGRSDIYDAPYELPQLISRDFVSNMDDWSIHGELLTAPRRVSFLDGFSLIFRPECYQEIGGWQACLDLGLPFHMYDAWANCSAIERGWEVWAIPVRCRHEGTYGRGTSGRLPEIYETVVRDRGYASGQHLFEDAHRKIYDRFRNLLPLYI